MARARDNGKIIVLFMAARSGRGGDYKQRTMNQEKYDDPEQVNKTREGLLPPRP
jgi:hypothetical protein